MVILMYGRKGKVTRCAPNSSSPAVIENKNLIRRHYYATNTGKTPKNKPLRLPSAGPLNPSPGPFGGVVPPKPPTECGETTNTIVGNSHVLLTIEA